jgi:hypothetical protein
VFGGHSLREESVADQTPAHVLTNDDEHLPDPVAVGAACLSPSFFVSSHVDQQ